MKKLFQPLAISFVLMISILTSCSPPYHVGTGDKRNNLSHWKADSKLKKEAREEARRGRRSLKGVDMVQK